MADWSTRYLAALDTRDKREGAHKSCIDAYTRLADRKTTVIPTLTRDNTSKRAPQSNDDGISRLRNDLLTTQAARSALQTQLLALQTTNSTLASTNSTLSSQLASTHRQITALERRLKDREDELKQKKKLVEEVHDEMVGLNMELNMLGQEKERLKGENAELVRRWMDRMRVEVDKANKEAGWN